MASPFSNPATRAPAAATAYVRSILALLGGRDPLEVLPRLAAEVRERVKGLSPAQLQRPEAPGKWSVHELVSHLADSEVVFGWRLRVVIAQDRPTITGFDQDAWVTRVRGAYPDSASAIQQIAVLREGHVALLTSLAPEDWERIGMHAERGPESVALMARLYAGHDLVHLSQLDRIRTAVTS
ncbi:MAG TPA: DinB family protein [Gemmatimonadales bacterium]